MYDMTRYLPRYYKIKLKNGRFIEVEPPKLKMLKKITSLSKFKNADDLSDKEIKNLIEAVSIALSKNKQGYRVSPEQVEEDFNIDETIDFLSEYFSWVNEIHDQKN